jgi:inosine-uridine nucleoside N-ribohydrolase
MIYGHEGLPFFETNVLIENLKMDFIKKQKQDNAAKFIVEQVKKYPNEVKIISIGIPSNIGLALNNNKEIIPLIKEIIIMGCGSVRKEGQKSDYNPIEEIKNGKTISLYPNHNISGDTLASKILFDSNIPTKIVSHTVSSQFWSEGPVIDFLRSKAQNEKDKKNPETAEGAVGLLMDEWFSRRHHQNGQCPHDPLTINEAVFGGEDSPIIYARGYIILHEWAAFGTFIPKNDGPHYLGVDLKKDNNFLKRLEKTIIG